MADPGGERQELENLVLLLIGRVKQLEGRIDDLEKRTARAEAGPGTPEGGRPTSQAGSTFVPPVMPPSPPVVPPAPPVMPPAPPVMQPSPMFAPPASLPNFVPPQPMPRPGHEWVQTPWSTPAAAQQPRQSYAPTGRQADAWQPPAQYPPAQYPSGWTRPQSPVAPPDRPPTPPGPTLAEELGISLKSLRDLESQITGRLLAWVGAAAVLLGSVFFLSLAFSRGWIGPEGRVGLGIFAGVVLGEAGVLLFGRKQAQLGHLLVALGLAITLLSLFAGTRLYGLYDPEVALAGAFVVAILAAVVAVREDSEEIAIYGLLGVAAAPPIMGAGANGTTIAFLSVTLIGTTAIALLKSWRWLPPTAFLITAPQLVYWISAGPEGRLGVVAIGAYWLLHAVAASADELRWRPAARRAAEEAATPSVADAPGDDLGRPEWLFLMNSVLAAACGYWVLSGPTAAWQGAFMAGLAIAHLAFGGFLIWRRGEAYPFALLVNGIAATAAAIAIERQFNGAAVVIGWAVEGVVLAAVFGWRKNSHAGSAALLLGALDAIHLCSFEYSWLNWNLQGHSQSGGIPFADQAGVALLGLLIAAFAAGWTSRRADVRFGLLIAGFAISAYSMPFELSGPALVAAWAVEAALVLAASRFGRVDYLAVVAVGVAGLALAHLTAFEYPLLNWSLAGTTGSGLLPFANASGLALAAVLGAFVLAGVLIRSALVRADLVVAGAAVLAYAMPFELAGPSLVAGWTIEVIALAVLWRRRPDPAFAAVAFPIGALSVAHLVAVEYPIGLFRLEGTPTAHLPFADGPGAALGLILAGAAVVGVVAAHHSLRCGLVTGVLLLLALVLPFELTGVPLLAAWALLVPSAVAAERLLDLLPGVPAGRMKAKTVSLVDLEDVGWPDMPVLAGLVATSFALAHLLVSELPIDGLTRLVAPATPFADAGSLAAGIAVAAFLLTALLTVRPDVRVLGVLIAAAIAAYALPFELAIPYALAGWAVIALIVSLRSRARPVGAVESLVVSAVLLAIAVASILVQVVPLQRLGVQPAADRTGLWFDVDAIVAIGAVCLVLLAAARLAVVPRRAVPAVEFAAGIGCVYLASTLLVNFFQTQVGGSVAVEELQKQAQVSVSILWGLIGMGVFLAGTVGWRQGVREGGLGLLALATLKVFFFDLSYLDVAYRVLSLIGLGVLMLIGAYLYQSLRPKRAAA